MLVRHATAVTDAQNGVAESAPMATERGQLTARSHRGCAVGLSKSDQQRRRLVEGGGQQVIGMGVVVRWHLRRDALMEVVGVIRSRSVAVLTTAIPESAARATHSVSRSSASASATYGGRNHPRAGTALGCDPTPFSLVRALDRAAWLCTCPLGGGWWGRCRRGRPAPFPAHGVADLSRRLRLLGTGFVIGTPPPRVTGHLLGVTTQQRPLWPVGGAPVTSMPPSSRPDLVGERPAALLAGLFPDSSSA